MNYVELGRRIRTLRRSANLTQGQLAQAAGMSPSFIGHIERGIRKVSLENLADIARILGVSTGSLMSDESVPVPSAAGSIGQTANYLGDKPVSDQALDEPANKVRFTPVTNDDTQKYMLRELISLLESKDWASPGNT